MFLLFFLLLVNQMYNNHMIEEDQPFSTIFLFINSGSGSGLGQKIISQEINKISFNIPINNEKDIRIINVYFINMRERKNKQFGFKKLRQLHQNNKKTIAIICGGDGTVMWVVSQYFNFGINPDLAPIGIIPIGTGNDFSRVLNWGAEKTMLLEQNFRSLKKLIRKWLNAKTSQFDVWDVTAQVFPDIGKFQKVQNEQSVKLQGNVYRTSFVNYFSFGVDGKIGYSFDLHRANSRFGNLAVYGALGLVKSATKTKTIDELVQSFYIKDQGQNDICIFKSKIGNQPEQNSTKYIQQGLQNILLLNIDSYTGGVNGIWQSGQQILIQQPLNREQVSFSDGKIQVLSFTSATAIAMERSFGGFAKRITQHSGPFIFNFKSYPNEEKHRTYLQIDGQFIRFTHPRRIIVQRSKMFKDGKIRVLVNDPQFLPYSPN